MSILKNIIRAYSRRKRGIDSSKMVATVLGAGSFGTVIANIIAENGYKTYLWTRDPDQAQFIKQYKRNPKYIKHVKLSSNIIPTSDLKEALSSNVQCIFFAIPSSSFETLLDTIGSYINSNQYFVSMIKGLGRSGKFQLMSSLLEEKLINLDIYNNNIGVLCGPNLAIEMAQRQITATVVASKNNDLIKFVQELVSCEYFHVFKSTDVVGVELGGILKKYIFYCYWNL